MTLQRILLVDDDADIRMIGRMSLERVGGWTVSCAPSGEVGILLATQQPQPDLILLDVMMPHMDGPTTLQRLRNNTATAQIPVIFITARAQVDEIRRYEALGVAGIIVKPFNPMTLPETIRAMFL